MLADDVYAVFAPFACASSTSMVPLQCHATSVDEDQEFLLYILQDLPTLPPLFTISFKSPSDRTSHHTLPSQSDRCSIGERGQAGERRETG